MRSIPAYPPPRARLADRLPRHDRAQPRGYARPDPRPASPAPPREPSAGRRSGARRTCSHSSWLALTDCLEYAILTRAGIAPGHPELLPDAGMPVEELAAILQPELDADDGEVLETVAATDWTQTTLDLADAADRTLAAHATALGVALFYSFGNFCAIAAHPRWDSVKRVNLLKGRPENQVGSLTSTRDRFERLFDWSLLPDGLDRAARARADGRLLRARPDGLPRPGGAPRPRPPHLARRRAADDAGDRPGLPVPVERAARRDPDAGRRGLPLHHLRERLGRRHRARSRRRTTTCAGCRTTSAARTASS